MPVRALALVALACLGSAAKGAGYDVRAGALAGGGWSTGPVRIEFDVGAGAGARVSAVVSDLRLPAPIGPVESIALACPAGTVVERSIDCEGARVTIRRPGDPPLSVTGRIRIDDDGRWRVDLGPAEIASEWVEAVLARALGAPVTVGGRVSAAVTIAGAATDIELGLRLAADGFGFSDASGLRAGEAIGATLLARLDRGADGWRASLDVGLETGAIFVDPIFVDLGEAPVRVRVEGRADDAFESLDVDLARVEQSGVAVVEGAARIDLAEQPMLTHARVELDRADVEPLYRRYLAPFLAGTVLDDLATRGAIACAAEWSSGAARTATCRLASVDVDEASARFSVLGLDGEVSWSRDGPPAPTRLRFDGAQVYRVDIGPAAIAGRLTGSRFELDGPVVLPFLDGGLRLDALEIGIDAGGGWAWRFDGELVPISLERLANTLAWLPFPGTLAGVIPTVRYAERVVEVGGTLVTRVFDGTVSIRNLSLEDPFGLVPVLRADVAIDDLSLDELTRAFAFGSIRGRLDGTVRGLVLEDWQPAAFDALVATPADDDSTRRISQRAVDNLASLGGASGVLSSTFLRFLDEFSYARLGLSCRLRDGVCEMGGVAPAERGYYIVEGGGFPPRIDVLGFNRRVDWPTLVGRLKRVTSGQGAVVR